MIVDDQADFRWSQNYEGFIEVGQAPAKRSLKTLVNPISSLHFWDACADGCETLHAPPMLSNWSAPRQHLPACSRQDPLPGVWLPAHYSDQMRSIQGYSFAPLPACRMDSHMEGLQATTTGDAKCKLEPRKLLITGDSHARFTFQELSARLAGNYSRVSGYVRAFTWATGDNAD